MTNAVDHSPRQTRHLSFVAEFTNDVQHVSSRDNVVADALSRTLTIAAVLSPKIYYRQFAADQATIGAKNNFLLHFSSTYVYFLSVTVGGAFPIVFLSVL